MIKLKCTDIIELDLKYLSGEIYTTLDCSSREYKNHGRVFYLGQGGQLVQFFERDLDKVIEFLNKVKELPLNKEREGWLK